VLDRGPRGAPAVASQAHPDACEPETKAAPDGARPLADRLIVEAAALAGLFGDVLYRTLEHCSLVGPHRES
jgi:hypothetical protein